MTIHNDILREITIRAERATPGPYFVTPTVLLSNRRPVDGRGVDGGYAGTTLVGESMRTADRDYFALLDPETVISVANELARLRMAIDHLRACEGDKDEAVKRVLAAAAEDDPIPF